ncbi:helix-turn-helix domain-containing protein [Gordonia alkaliphila]|uniref:PucR family transcriptional regulator n=1 Tax=Gordonia alkaliphila TaxID=1053547 RepID=UPI001FF1808C|nr:helix-turn-helix domain-containing protein [Gordonia alkaliphila]MCK0440048.1 helix-turn-helix domain-containing protein [Gordonia alkaliphila]
MAAGGHGAEELERSTWQAGPGPVSPAVADLIRAGVQVILEAPTEWTQALDDSVLAGAGMGLIAEDPALTEVVLRTNAGNIAHWAAMNAAHPGERVSVAITDETVVFVRDAVRRGFDSGVLDSFRTAQNLAWRLWMEICFGLTDDPALLRELLAVTLDSIARFVDDTVSALAEMIDVARAELAGDTHAQRRAAVALLLEGAPLSEARAVAQLGYRLDGPQLAAVISGGPESGADRLEAVCEAIMTASGIATRLTVLAGASQLWVWFPAVTVDVDAVPADVDDVRVTLGAPGVGREGFRRSHFQALAAFRLLGRLGSQRRFARYDELRLLEVVTDDDARIDEFLAATLGDLLDAEPELAECLRVWFAQRCNAAATAQQLYTHRNTVVRRLAKAESLLPVSLAESAITVAAALELQHWRRPASG